jgi:hypothetical protein
MPLPENFLRVNARPQDLGAEAPDPGALRKEIEPWLSAVFQSEHLSLLIGNGFPIAVAGRAGATATSMEAPTFAAAHADKVVKHAEFLATEARRGAPNIEDHIRSALQLLGGLEVLEDGSVEDWRQALRAYPGRGSAIVAFQVMSAQARWSSARWFSGFFDQRIRMAR